MGRHKHFRIWFVSLPILVIAGLAWLWLQMQTNSMMETETNPFGAVGMLMVYSYYISIAMVVCIIAGIVTLMSLVIQR